MNIFFETDLNMEYKRYFNLFYTNTHLNMCIYFPKRCILEKRSAISTQTRRQVKLATWYCHRLKESDEVVPSVTSGQLEVTRAMEMMMAMFL